jgi:hypothetical protein
MGWANRQGAERRRRRRLGKNWAAARAGAGPTDLPSSRPAATRRDSRAPAGEPRLAACCDRDSAARFLFQRHANIPHGQPERFRDVIADLHGERLAEVPLVAEAVQVQLQRLRLEAEILRGVPDRGDVEIRLTGDGTDSGELVTRQLDLRDAGIGKRLQPGVVLRARVTEGDELG